MKRLPLFIVLIIPFLLLTAAPTQSQSLPSDLLQEKLRARIAAFDANFDGVLGVAAIDLTTNQQFSYHGNILFPQASSIKIPVMVEVFRQAREGKFRLSDELEITEKFLVGGSGRFQQDLKAGKKLEKSVREIVEAMIIWSDNVATNVCIDLVGMENVNRTLKELGFSSTRLQRKMMDAEAVRRNDENISTPAEMVRLAQLIYEGKLVDAQACEEMVEILARVQAGMRAAVPEQYRVAAKPGGVPGVKCETGIVYFDARPFALSVMSTYKNEKVENPVKAVTQQVFEYFERLGHSNIYGHRTSRLLQQK